MINHGKIEGQIFGAQNNIDYIPWVMAIGLGLGVFGLVYVTLCH